MANTEEKCGGCPFVNSLNGSVDYLRKEADYVASDSLSAMFDHFEEWSSVMLALEKALSILDTELADPKEAPGYQQLELRYLCAESEEQRMYLIDQMQKYLEAHRGRIVRIRLERLALTESFDEENYVRTESYQDSLFEAGDENLIRIEQEIDRLLEIIRIAKEGCQRGRPGITMMGHLACKTKAAGLNLTSDNRRGIDADKVINHPWGDYNQ